MIQIESDIYFHEHGELQEGEVVVLGAHNLKCKHIFHAVGPTWDGGKRGETVLLGMLIRCVFYEFKSLLYCIFLLARNVRHSLSE